MKGNFLSVVLMWFCVTACVKDSKDKEAVENLFQVKVTSTNISTSQDLKNFTFIADSYTQYALMISEKSGIEIEDGKQVTVTVSDGTVWPNNGIPVANRSSQTTVYITGGKAIVFYMPGRRARNPAYITFAIQNVSHSIAFKIEPLVPTSLLLTTTNKQIRFNINETVGLKVFLQNINSTSNGYVSDDLPIYFQIKSIESTNPFDPIVADVVPDNRPSKFDGTDVIAENILSTNRKPGKITLNAYYNSQIFPLASSRDLTIEFVP